MSDMTKVVLAFSTGALIAFAFAYLVLGVVWFRQLARLNPSHPISKVLILAAFWPYCEWKADR